MKRTLVFLVGFTLAALAIAAPIYPATRLLLTNNIWLLVLTLVAGAVGVFLAEYSSRVMKL